MGNSPGRKQQRTCELLCAVGRLGTFFLSFSHFSLDVISIMILWTLRHTKPHNPNNYCYGRADFEVAPSFDAEFPPALEALKPCRASHLFSSPLKRCKTLADKVSDHLSLPIETKDALMEIHFGSWEMQELAKVPRDEMNAWRQNWRGYRFPGGESFHDVDKRVLQFLDSCMGLKEMLWVTHAGVIAVLHHAVCGVPDSDFVEGRFPYAMVTRFEIEKNSNGKYEGHFDTLYGGIQQPPLNV